ncbi:hypothetical protein HD806DRAFT_402341 [Xylariaceae sp. AK1471]|nr:hypothetical protein HD806DRAFT_402341 [Xylariaceae sp. AK1471]
MHAHSIFTALGVLAAVSTVTAVEPFAATSLRFSSDSKTCDCYFPGKSTVVEEIETGRCIPTSREIQSLAVNITGDWNVFLFVTSDCSDEGGWVFPQTAEIPLVCNYNIGTVAAYAILDPNDPKYRVGGLRGKIDQRCPVHRQEATRDEAVLHIV